MLRDYNKKIKEKKKSVRKITSKFLNWFFNDLDTTMLVLMKGWNDNMGKLIAICNLNNLI